MFEELEISNPGPSDWSNIRSLIEEAFEGSEEASLVEALRADRDMELEMVATVDDQLIGHIAYSKLKAPIRAVALAPLCVAPAHQKQGMGTALMTHSLECLKRTKWQAVFVLGDTAYYGRAGFTVKQAEDFDSPYSGPYFMALELENNCLRGTRGALDHAPAFGNLS